MRLTRVKAIEVARERGLTLCKYGDPTEGPREGLSVEEAEEVAREDAGLIYLDVEHLAEGPYQPGGNGTLPSRVVLRNLGGYKPWVTHCAVYETGGEVRYQWGHYFEKEEDAREDFAARVKRGF